MSTILTCYDLNIRNATGKLREFYIRERDAYVKRQEQKNRKSRITWDRVIGGEEVSP